MFETLRGVEKPAGKKDVRMPAVINPDEFVGTPEEVALLRASQAADRKLFDERANQGAETVEETSSAAIGLEHIRVGSVTTEDADAATKLAEQRVMDSMQAFFEESQRNAAEKSGDQGAE